MSNQPICGVDTPDPWLIPSPLRPGIFYLTFTLGNRIEVWSSPRLEDFRQAEKTIAWQPAPQSLWSADIWAPELHYLYGQWYIYAAAAQPGQGNPSHRTIVLRCQDQDPMRPNSWDFLGPLPGLPEDQWSIDATVFSPDPADRPDNARKWYICYSGWPLGDHSDTQQDLFLAVLTSPTAADGKTLTCISRASLPWERPEEGRRGVNEGPTYVDFGPGQWRGIVFSGNGSWTSEYKLGLVQYTGKDSNMCDSKLWEKRPTPLLVGDKTLGGPFGPGHASFVLSPYMDNRIFCIYHGTEHEGEGWNNRKARVLCMTQDMFLPDRPPMCCALGASGTPADVKYNAGQSAQEQQHLGMPQQPQIAGNVSASRHQDFGKYLDKAGRFVPGQYRGLFDTARRLFKQ